MEREERIRLEQEVGTKIIHDLIECQNQTEDGTCMIRILCSVLSSIILSVAYSAIKDQEEQTEFIVEMINTIKSLLEYLCLSHNDAKSEIEKTIDFITKILDKYQSLN